MTAPLDLMGALVLEDGRRWAAAAAPWQWDMVRTVLDPTAPPYRWESRPRGGSKTTDAAGLALVMLVAALPPGTRCYTYAVDRDQARLVVDALAGFVARTPELAAHVDVGQYRVTAASGSVLEVLAADAASAWGIRPAFVVADEVTAWLNTANARGLWEATFSSLGKLPGARLLAITTSGDPAHWTRRIYDRARKSPLWTVADVPGPLGWVSPAYLDEQRRMLPESVYRRLHLNEWAAPEDRLTSVADLRGCVTLDGPLEPVDGARYVIGVDLGLKHDRTVAAVCHAEPDGPGVRVVLDRMQVWAGKRFRPVDLGGVEDWLRTAAQRYRRAKIVADPYQMTGMAQRLVRGGLTVEEFPFSQQSVGRLAIALHTAVRERRLALPDDEALLDELANVRLRETSPGVLRLDHDPDRHDDRAIALALAVLHLTEHTTANLDAYKEHWRRYAEGARSRDGGAGSGLPPEHQRRIRQMLRTAPRFGPAPTTAHPAAVVAVPNAAVPRCTDPGGHRWRRSGGEAGADHCVLCHAERQLMRSHV